MEVVGEVFESTKHFWSLRGKQRCRQIQYNRSNFFFNYCFKQVEIINC